MKLTVNPPPAPPKPTPSYSLEFSEEEAKALRHFLGKQSNNTWRLTGVSEDQSNLGDRIYRALDSHFDE